MYDELVKRLREQAVWFGELDNVSDLLLESADAIENTSKAYQMMAEAYESEVTKQYWIPVAERPPEANEEVFIYLWDRPSPYIAWVDPEGRWETNDFYIDVEDTPKAWMPLPEPPKEE